MCRNKMGTKLNIWRFSLGDQFQKCPLWLELPGVQLLSMYIINLHMRTRELCGRS